MTNPITQITGSVQQAPTPNLLQQKGALISQGATTLGVGQTTLLTALADLTAILNGALALSSLSYSANTVTATTAAPHGLAGSLWLTIAGAVPAGYNGNFLCTITGASTFTYQLATNPGSETTPGTYTEEDVAELLAMGTTFFGMGSQVAVSVLELGPGSPANGVTALSNFITQTLPQQFYLYLVPRTWGAEPTFLTLMASYEAFTSKTYFLTTLTLQNYSGVTAAMKCALPLIEAPAQGIWPANVVTAASYSDGFITFTTTTNHGVAIGQWFNMSGFTPAGYNGWFKAKEGTATNSLVAAVPADPTAESVLGTLNASSGSSTGIGTTEFDLADTMWTILSWGLNNLVPPLQFNYMFGATPFPLKGNAALLSTLATANVSYVGTGAEGGISTSIIFYGKTADGNQFNYWYAIDWMQIQGQLNVTNAVIVGSNNSEDPLYYNQQGINTLQSVLAGVCKTGIGKGLLLGSLALTELDPSTFATNVENGVYDGQVVINAVPFAIYTSLNPSNYGQGLYGGLAVAFTPQTGFTQIIVNLQAVPLVLGG